MISLSRPRPHVALVHLQRPARRNALDLAGFRALADAWRSIAARAPGAVRTGGEEVRVVVVTGDKDFSTGTVSFPPFPGHLG